MFLLGSSLALEPNKNLCHLYLEPKKNIFFTYLQSNKQHILSQNYYLGYFHQKYG